MTDQNHYLIEYECINCGSKFSKQLRKGTAAHGNGGTCPNCGVGENKIGQHRVIRANESTDPTGGRQILNEYQKPPRPY